MNTIEHLRELFIYNDWANRRTITALKTSSGERARQIMAHILITEKEYFARLYGKDSTGFDFWQDLSLDDCGKLAQENAENYEHLLKRFDDEGLGQIAKYKTSEGVPQQNNFRELLTHILFHSMNHRGQVNSAMRDDGFAPPSTDYIIYLRETS
ncbi:MAG: DinB family protein [Pyrinomonadaceae bacterium]